MNRSSFTEDEGRQILARAAERQEEAERAQLASGREVSLSELTEIAREVGIDPSYVQAAAGELALRSEAEPVGTSLGLPRRLSEVRMLPGTVSDRQWEGMVTVFRETFKRPGIVSQFGEVREWMSSNDVGDAMPVKIRLEPHEDGTLLTMSQATKGITQLGGVLSGTFAGVTAALALLVAVGSFESAVWALPGIFAGFSVASLFGTIFGGRSFVRRRDAEFDRVADQVESIGRPEDT